LSAIDFLCEIIALKAKASAASYNQHPDFEALFREGFIQECGVAQSVTCLECDTTHDGEIIHVGGKYGYHCPDLGFVAVERSEIMSLQPNMPRVVLGLADAFGCRRRKSTTLQGTTWRIGTVPSEGGDITLYFHPCLSDEQDALELSTALSRDVRTAFRVILTAAGTLPLPYAKTALLTDVVEFPADRSEFSVLADPHDIAGAPRRNPGGAPNRFQDLLVQILQSRVNDCIALKGRNAEAKAAREQFCRLYPDAKPPSLSSVQDYVTKFRSSQ
jgi:hypothetical protein